MGPGVRLLTPGDVRELAGRLEVRPSKRLGQNFVIEPGTVRRIAALAGLRPDDVVLEVGPGLGSLTLALLEALPDPAGTTWSAAPPPVADADRSAAPPPVADADRSAAPSAVADPDRPVLRSVAAGSDLAGVGRVVAVEIDPVLAAELPRTVADRAPDLVGRLAVVAADALRIAGPDLPAAPTALVANLPYNVAVPVVLHLLAVLPSLERGLVMVQAEVADRMCAGPGSRVYGAPSAKLAWYAAARSAGPVPRSVFWPVPNVDSRLVAFTRRDPPESAAGREEVFAVIDAAFRQRRKTLRAALAGWAGSAAEAERLLRAAGLDPGARGESLDVSQFARLAAAQRLEPRTI
jgi:16S rRNA (adenine1518-N6/adenine1519-N6)-dimethyltransferase